jgi:integrase
VDPERREDPQPAQRPRAAVSGALAGGQGPKSFRTKGEADRYWLKVRTDLAKPAEELVTVDELVDRWLATKRGLSPRGYRACLDASRHVKERWGDELANDLARHDVEAWLAGLPFGGSLKGKVLQCLSGAFKTFPALDNPCLGVRVRQEQKREARFLTVDELYELAEKVGAHYGSLVMFLGTTGVRIGECVALNVSDVDRARARVRVWKSRDRKSTKGSRAGMCRRLPRCWTPWTSSGAGVSRCS